MADLEQSLEELEVVKQTFKSNFNASDVSTTNVEFRNYPNLMSQLEKKLPIQNKSISPTTSAQSVSADAGYKLGSVEVGAVVPSDYYKPEESVTIQPMTIEQNITPSSGSVFNGVKVNAVTSDIDSNIQEENIKDGVTILGVTGTHKGESGGGEGTTTIDGYVVRVVDYDGTILKEDVLQTGDTFTLPDLPTNHERLVAQGWSSTASITNNQVIVEDEDIIIGAIYTTASGLSEFDIELNKVTGLSVTFNMSGNKNWGDGTTDTATTHTYADYGKYTITCDGTSLPSSGLFGQSTSNSVNYFCTDVRFANITIIPNYVLRFCYSLKTVTLPNGVTSIGASAFNSCYTLNAVILPNTITIIYNQAFYYCSCLKYTFIPNSVTNIGESAFSGSRTALKKYGFSDNITNIGLSAFAYNLNLTNVKIPNGITRLNDSTFRYCYNLISVEIPNSVTIIGTYLFADCNILENVILGDGVTTIGENAFQNCNRLENITIPDGVTYIGKQAFYRCYNLQRISIPSGVTNINASLFYDCISLREIDFSKHTTIPTMSNTSPLYTISKLCKIIVPDDLYDAWIAATNWSTFANYIYKASEII